MEFLTWTGTAGNALLPIMQLAVVALALALVAKLIFVLAGPPLWLAQVLLYGYVVTRLLHFAAYLTAQTHDMRALLWTPGSLILIFITLWSLVAAIT